jgi:pSer/pThr/pTyr-binding forkhead associated (FHA) protein
MTGSSDETDIVHPVDGANADTAADTGHGVDAGAEPAETGLTAADQATIEALNQGTALLVVRYGPTAGARFLLDADVTTVGRHPGNDIFLDDVTVSRKHAQFVRAAQGFAVRDVGSLNGTYVGRQRIDGDVQLRTGDEVQVGKFRFLYQQSPQRSAQSPSPSPPAAGGGE